MSGVTENCKNTNEGAIFRKWGKLQLLTIIYYVPESTENLKKYDS